MMPEEVRLAREKYVYFMLFPFVLQFSRIVRNRHLNDSILVLYVITNRILGVSIAPQAAPEPPKEEGISICFTAHFFHKISKFDNFRFDTPFMFPHLCAHITENKTTGDKKEDAKEAFKQVTIHSDFSMLGLLSTNSTLNCTI